MLKNIETLTYNFTETEQDHARELASDLEKMYSKYLALLPKQQGLTFHPKSPITTQYMRRKVQKARLALKCSTLPPPRKTRKTKGPFVRVGAKAERKQKVNITQYTDLILKCLK